MSLVTDQWSDASVLSLSSKAADKLWSHKLDTTREVYTLDNKRKSSGTIYSLPFKTVETQPCKDCKVKRYVYT